MDGTTPGAAGAGTPGPDDKAPEQSDAQAAAAAGAPDAAPAPTGDAPAGPPQLADAGELKARLRTAADVVVAGRTYRVRPVSMLLFVKDPTAMWQAARKDKALLDRMLRAAMVDPDMDQLRRVLVSGMVHPRVVAAEGAETAGSIWVDTLLADYTLATELYLAIVKASM